MKLIQPPPLIDSPLLVPPNHRLQTSLPLTFLKYRYQHHAAASGYDRICDYIEASTIRLPLSMYWAGESLLRPFCIWLSKYSKKREYSRYDCVMEIEFLRRALLHETNKIYYFVYGEKSFHLSEHFMHALKKRGHKIVAAVHHSEEQMHLLFNSLHHFKCFDLLLTMDVDSVPFWQRAMGRDAVFHVPHGIDTDFFKPIPNSFPSKIPRVVFAGAHERDFQALDCVISELDEYRHYQFDLIGKSGLLVDLKQRFPDTVNLYHRPSDIEYRSLVQQASVLLLPLLNSTTCNVVLEALACGTPVVTTKGGISAYLEPNSSRCYQKGDYKGLISGLRELCEQGAYARMAARQQALNYSWKKIAHTHLAILGRYL